MKVKIKGLVFVGFAAAILSANAMADDANTVTSKSYVDAKIQVQTGTEGSIFSSNSPDNKAPSSLAVYTALDALETTVSNMDGQAYSAGTGLSLDDHEFSNTGVTSVSATGQNGSDGTIMVSTAGGAATEVAVKNVEVITHKLDGSTGHGIADTTSGVDGNEGTMYPSAKAVKDYVSDQLTTNGGTVYDNTISFTQSGAAVDSFTVNASAGKTIALPVPNWNAASGTAGYIDNKPTDIVNVVNTVKVNNSALTPDGDKAVNVTIGSGTANGSINVNGTDVAVTNVEVNTNKVTSLSASSTDTQYPSAKAVYDMFGGNTIPQKSTLCNTHPCALVAETNGLHWYTMASANYDGGVRGDYCTTNTDCAGGTTGYTTCNTTTHECGAQ